MFPSAGRRVELLREFRAACKRLGQPARIVALDRDPLAPTSQVADRTYRVPSIVDPAYLSTLLEIIRSETVRFIFPVIDPEIPFLASHRSEFEGAGACPVVVCPDAAAIAEDKWKTFEFFSKLGLPTPRSWVPGTAVPSGIEFPILIKPRRGSASKGVTLVQNEKELRFFSAYVPDPILQECMQGPEITSDVVADLDGKVLAIVSRRRIEVRSGEVLKGITVHDPRIIDGCLKVASELPARGPITVQCFIHQGKPHFSEINARLGGGFPLGLAAGALSLDWFLGRALKIDVDVPPLGTYEVGLRMTRYDAAFYLELPKAQP